MPGSGLLHGKKAPECQHLGGGGSSGSSSRLYGSAAAPSAQKMGNVAGLEAGATAAVKDHGLLFKDPSRWLKEMAHWLENSEQTDPAHHLSSFCDELKPRRLKAPLVLGWIVLQAANLVFSFILLGEISQHLTDFESTLAVQCAPEHIRQGICLGAAWNLSYSSVITFPANDASDGSSGFDFVIAPDRSFSFSTQSQPPTFLLGVETRQPNPGMLNRVRWKVSITPVNGVAWNTYSNHAIDDVNGYNSMYKVISVRPEYSAYEAGYYSQARQWSGSISLTGKTPSQTDILVYIVDSRVEHLDEIHKQEQCSFENSWQNFSERHNGEHHRVLTLTHWALSMFILVSGALLALVLYRFYFYVESGKLLRRVISLKFVIQDFPQQVFIVAYLYGWYAKNGLRCQMCLFHPLHCEYENPLHWSNLLACLFAILSASANQLMLQAKIRQHSDGEDECCVFFARAVLFSVSALPFSTAIYLFPFWFPRGSHLVLILILAGVPMIAGWATVLCIPMLACCGDDCD